MKELLRVERLCKNGILRDVSFAMGEGEMIAVMGPSGSGKSTLLYNVSGMDQADGGKVLFFDKEIVGLSEDQKAALRLTEMGFVFQQMNVLANLSIIDNIIFPAIHADKSKAGKKNALQKARSLMEQFGIEELADRSVAEVSGGQLQRACICRSMMLNPKIIFADEPTGALNQSASRAVIDAFLEINEEGTSIMMVTHDSKVASRCQRILYIIDGEIKGELELGAYCDVEEEQRERKTAEWLKTLGW